MTFAWVATLKAASFPNARKTHQVFGATTKAARIALPLFSSLSKANQVTKEQLFYEALALVDSGEMSKAAAARKYGVSTNSLRRRRPAAPNKSNPMTDEMVLALAKKHKMNAYAAAKEIGMNHSPMARRFRDLGLRDTDEEYHQEITSNLLLITSAVSGAHVDKNALEVCQKWAELTGGQLIVIPQPYRNPTSQFESPDRWYDPTIVRYLCNQRVKLAKHLTLYADIHQQPTKANPLEGKQFFGGDASAIFPHTTQEFESVPVSLGKHSKWLATTGAITKPTYSDSGAGAQGRENHTMGALVIEIDGGLFHARHVGFNKDGSFQDLTEKYEKTGNTKPRVDLMKLGDLHGINVDPVALKSTLQQIQELQPRHVILEDVHDHQAGSHHADFFTQHGLHKRGLWSVEKELHASCKLIDKIANASPADCKVVITKANHNEHLKKWLENPRNAHDVVNAEIYHQLKAAVLQGHENPLEVFYARNYGHPGVRFLKLGEGYVVNKIESGAHGDKGPGGARGSALSFARIGAKMNTGHSHAPRRKQGSLQAGTLSKMMNYAKGAPCAWMASNIVQYADGKRTLVNIIRGKYRSSAGSC